ncbi:MAG: hypothetical protein P1P73_00320, partial [Brevefilum sp.]|nr:hypothetical protein [Brevefilum sp.]
MIIVEITKQHNIENPVRKKHLWLSLWWGHQRDREVISLVLTEGYALRTPERSGDFNIQRTINQNIDCHASLTVTNNMIA